MTFIKHALEAFGVLHVVYSMRGTADDVIFFLLGGAQEQTNTADDSGASS